MQYKSIGNSKVPVIGQGTGGIKDANTIKRGIELGLTLIDTAESYGNEEIIKETQAVILTLKDGEEIKIGSSVLKVIFTLSPFLTFMVDGVKEKFFPETVTVEKVKEYVILAKNLLFKAKNTIKTNYS